MIAFTRIGYADRTTALADNVLADEEACSDTLTGYLLAFRVQDGFEVLHFFFSFKLIRDRVSNFNLDLLCCIVVRGFDDDLLNTGGFYHAFDKVDYDLLQTNLIANKFVWHEGLLILTLSWFLRWSKKL